MLLAAVVIIGRLYWVIFLSVKSSQRVWQIPTYSLSLPQKLPKMINILLKLKVQIVSVNDSINFCLNFWHIPGEFPGFCVCCFAWKFVIMSLPKHLKWRSWFWWCVCMLYIDISVHYHKLRSNLLKLPLWLSLTTVFHLSMPFGWY